MILAMFRNVQWECFQFHILLLTLISHIAHFFLYLNNLFLGLLNSWCPSAKHCIRALSKVLATRASDFRTGAMVGDTSQLGTSLDLKDQFSWWLR